MSRSQFDAYYASQISGVGVWVSSVALFPSPIARGPTSPELGSSLAATAADSTINRRSDGSTLTSHTLTSPTKLTERDCVRGDLTETNELATGERMTNHEFHFEFIKGQHHYQRGGKKEDLQSPASRAGYEAERFQHEKKTKKCESN